MGVAPPGTPQSRCAKRSRAIPGARSRQWRRAAGQAPVRPRGARRKAHAPPVQVAPAGHVTGLCQGAPSRAGPGREHDDWSDHHRFQKVDDGSTARGRGACGRCDAMNCAPRARTARTRERTVTPSGDRYVACRPVPHRHLERAMTLTQWLSPESASQGTSARPPPPGEVPPPASKPEEPAPLPGGPGGEDPLAVPDQDVPDDEVIEKTLPEPSQDPRPGPPQKAQPPKARIPAYLGVRAKICRN